METCPPAERLARLRDPQLASEEREAMTRHAEQCVPCRAAIVELFRGGEPDPVDLAATSPAETVSASGVVARAVAAATSAAGSSPPLEPGTMIGRYVIEERLGAGAMGVVHAARDPELDRAVAVKLLRPGRDGEALRARLYREAQALARVAHPNVVAVHDVGTHDGQVFITMELIRGSTLRTWLRTPRPWREVLATLVQAGRGLAAAHAAGLVHRDFKPDNVLVGDDGRARVTDFGLARATLGPATDPGTRSSPGGAPSPLYSDMTETGTFLGTPAYAAPEQLAGLDSDALADQFAFCVATWEALFGRRPFLGGSLEELAASVRAGPPVPSGAAARKVPSAIRKALARGLAASPAARWPTMDALLRALTFERRRVVLIGAAAGVAALAGVATIALAARAPAAACTGLDAPLAGVWDAKVAAQLEQRFLASGQPQAAQRFALVKRTLDRYAADWRAEREDACGDSRVRRDQTEAELALRNGCLDERLAELSALTRELAGADAAAVDHAPDAARGLGRIATCGKPLQLGAVSPPDPAIAAEVLAVREELNRAQTRAALVSLAEGETLLAAARIRAEKLDYGPLLAEVHLAIALVAWAREDYPATIREAREAMMIAERVRWDEVKVRAAQALMRALIETGELAEAERVAELADATIARLGGDAALESTQRLDRGILLVKSKRAAEAVPLLEAELAAREAAGDDPLGAATVMLELQLAYTNVSRHADAAAMIARHEPIMDAYYGNSGEAKLQRIVSQSLQAAQRGDMASAIELTDRAHQLMTQLRAPDDIDLAHSEMGQAINYLLIEDWAHMREHAHAAAARYEKVNHAHQAANMLEYACWGASELGEHATAIAECRRGVELAASEPNAAAAEQLVYSRYQLAKVLIATGGDGDAEALALLDDVMPRMEKVAGASRQVLGSIRFLQAQALWRRNRSGDRARALALAVQARGDFVAHRDQFDPADGLSAIYHRSSDRLIGRIDDWRAARER